VAVVSVLFIAVMFVAVERYGAAAEWVTHEQRVLRESADLLSTVKDAETSRRGYCLQAGGSTCARSSRRMDEFYKQLKQLRRLTSRNRGQRQKVDEFAEVMDQKLSELNETLRLKREFGLDAAMAVVLSDRGRNFITALREQTDGFRVEVEQGSRDRVNSQELGRRVLMSATCAVALTGLASSGVCYSAGYRSSRRFRNVGSASSAQSRTFDW